MKTIYIALLLTLGSPLWAGERPLHAERPQSAPPPAASAAEWSQDTFEADVYPSQQSAARRLAIKFAAEISASGNQLPPLIRIIRQGAVSPIILQEIRSSLQSHLDGVDCRIGDPESSSVTATTAPAELRAVVTVESPSQSSSASRQLPRGTITLSPVANPIQSLSVAYVEKPWADNFAEFVNRRPNERWVVGWPSGPSMNEPEAHAMALLAAADRIRPIVEARIKEIGYRNGANAAIVRQQVESSINRYVKDRFAQRFDRGFATTWREAVLVDASGPYIDQLARASLATVDHQRRTWAHTAISIAVLLVVIYALYLFLNAATKGYFTWRLRTVALLLAVIGVLAVLFLMTFRLRSVSEATSEPMLQHVSEGNMTEW
jgi:uncharacterized integral membrane protein